MLNYSIQRIFLSTICVSLFGQIYTQANVTLSRDHVAININELVFKWLGRHHPLGVPLEINPLVESIQREFLEINMKFSRIQFELYEHMQKGFSEVHQEYILNVLSFALGSFNNDRGRLAATLIFHVDPNNFPYGNSLNSSLHRVLKFANLTNSICSGSVTTLQLSTEEDTKASPTEILTQLKFAKDEILRNRLDLKLSLCSAEDGVICLDDSESQYVRGIIFQVVDFVSIQIDWDCNDLTDENEDKAFRDSVDKVQQCERNAARVTNNVVLFGITSLCYFSRVHFDKFANYWRRMSDYARDINQTVVMLEIYVPVIRDFIYSSSVQSTSPELFQFQDQNKNRTASERERNEDVNIRAKTEVASILSNNLTLVITIGSGVVLTLLLTGIVFLYRNNKKLKTRLNGLTQSEIQGFLNGNRNGNETGSNLFWDSNAYDTSLEIVKEDFFVDTDTILGSGQFGCVYRGSVNGIGCEMAFKTVRNTNTNRDKMLKGLLSEIKVLSHLGKHENIVNIVGAYTAELENGIVYVMTELCSRGSLDKFLQLLGNSQHPKEYLELIDDSKNCPEMEACAQLKTRASLLHRLAMEICNGMKFIASKKVVHADLAARNILLTSNLTAKISDFGLSRRLYQYTTYVKKKQEPLPWKWMAPETLKSLKLSEKSDVWSYAVTIWEIFSLGDTPYGGLQWHIGFANDLENGLMLACPQNCPEELYSLMRICWATIPESRPTFSELHDRVASITM